MTDFSGKVRVIKRRGSKRGKHHASYFTAVFLNEFNKIKLRNSYITVSASNAVLNELEIRPGQIWYLEGNFTDYVIQNGSFKKKEDLLVVSKAELRANSGINFVDIVSREKAFKGIGRQKALHLWDTFQQRIYEILDRDDYVELSKHMKESFARNLVDAWKEYGHSPTLAWLDEMGLPDHVGRLAWKIYGDKTKEILSNDPYALVSFAFDWFTLDDIAQNKLNVKPDDKSRLIGAVEEALYRNQKNGSTASTLDMLKNRLKELLRGNKGHISLALSLEETDGVFYKSKRLFHSASSYLMEQYVAERIRDMTTSSSSINIPLDFDEIIAGVEETNGYELTVEQIDAVKNSVQNQFSIITGGAGVGKTTVLKALFTVMASLQYIPIQVAIAGLAAKRMEKSTGQEASTVWRFLYEFDELNITSSHYLVIDESSMISLKDSYSLLSKMPDNCKIIMVGDPVQLPPVGAGLVFKPLCEIIKTQKKELTVIKRQSGESGIPKVANAIREHKWVNLPKYGGVQEGVSLINTENEDESTNQILTIYDQLIRKDPDVKILCTTKNYGLSAKKLNDLLQQKYRKNDTPVSYFHDDYDMVTYGRFKVHDLIMFTRNDYCRGLRNGSLGRIIKAYPPVKGTMYICQADFEGDLIELTVNDLQDIVLSYALTVHKSQGNQFSRVIIAIQKSPRILDQSFIYTAITRAVNQCVLVGSESVMISATTSPSNASKRVIGLDLMLDEVLNEDTQDIVLAS